MNTYQIKPSSGSGESTIQADFYEFDSQTGRHLFYVGTDENRELVGNLLNVSVQKVEPEQPLNP